MPVLRFQGHGEERFAEVEQFEIEGTNRGSGVPVVFVLEQAERRERCLIVGEYEPGAGGWSIRAIPGPEGGPVPPWPMAYEPGPVGQGHILVVEAPEGVTICLVEGA